MSTRRKVGSIYQCSLDGECNDLTCLLLLKVSHKTIGKLGSFAIAVNALAGPGLLELPFTYQQSGIIPTTLALLLVGLISALCCMHTANVVSKVPGNSNFDKVVEFSDPYRIFWGRRAYYGTQVVFYLCTLCVNIAAIVDTAEIVDSFLGHSPMGSFGLSFDNGGMKRWKHEKPCSRAEVKLGECLPFEGEEYGEILLTLGYLITTVAFLPICLMDLKVRHSNAFVICASWHSLDYSIFRSSTILGKHCLANIWIHSVDEYQPNVRNLLYQGRSQL